jgi:hypothetical protein
MLRTEMPWYAKLGTAIVATAIAGGCIIAILLALPIGLACDLGNWLRRCAVRDHRGGCHSVARGLLHPIMLDVDVVVDGRNRLRACERAGIDPQFVQPNGQDGQARLLSRRISLGVTSPKRDRQSP